MVKIFYCDVSTVNNVDCLINSLPTLRRDYVQSISDFERKKQSVLVWKLLERALFLCYSNKEFNFICESDGLWKIKGEKIKFSLAHSLNLVVVAISENSVGVDVENCCDKLLKLKKRYSECDNLEELAIKWTKEESQFKAKDTGEFTSLFVKDNFGHDYIITACHNNADCAEFYSEKVENLL